MKRLSYCKFFLVISLASLPLQLIANTEQPEQEANKTIDKLYHNLRNKPKLDMTARISYFSSQLLNRPYVLGALGEGDVAKYDQAPLYRIDAFDCETFVDTVLALALAENPTTFKQCIRKIRYKNGQVSFISRNHFASLDWNRNNQNQGFLKDITATFRDKKDKPVVEIANAYINKPAWYQHFTIEKIRINNATLEEKTKRLQILKQEGSRLEKVSTPIPYVPLSALFDESGKANMFLFDQIPDGAIVEIVRPNWNLKEKIGTNLNVSHLGFAIREKGRLIFREASAIHQYTMDIPLIDYLKEALQSPTIKGINIQIVLPQEPLTGNCTPKLPVQNKKQKEPLCAL